MIQSLENELEMILSRIDNPVLGPAESQIAERSLVTFCRGFLVGLRCSRPETVDTDIANEMAWEWRDRKTTCEERMRALAERRKQREEQTPKL